MVRTREAREWVSPLSTCRLIETCIFFNAEVGYSPDLQAVMRQQYCLGDSSQCARLLALEFMPREELPPDMIPTDHEQLERLRRERTGGGAD